MISFWYISYLDGSSTDFCVDLYNSWLTLLWRCDYVRSVDLQSTVCIESGFEMRTNSVVAATPEEQLFIATIKLLLLVVNNQFVIVRGAVQHLSAFTLRLMIQLLSLITCQLTFQWLSWVTQHFNCFQPILFNCYCNYNQHLHTRISAFTLQLTSADTWRAFGVRPLLTHQLSWQSSSVFISHTSTDAAFSVYMSANVLLAWITLDIKWRFSCSHLFYFSWHLCMSWDRKIWKMCNSITTSSKCHNPHCKHEHSRASVLVRRFLWRWHKLV